MNLQWVVTIVVVAVVLILAAFIAWKLYVNAQRVRKNYARSLKMIPMMIHLPPPTDDVQVGTRDERDVIGEQISEANMMYGIIASTLKKGLRSKIEGQKHLSFEIIAHNGQINYYAVVPAVLTETVKQAVTASYPNARLEEVPEPNFFSEDGKIDGVSGGELRLKEEFWLPIASYEDTRRDASIGIINALSNAKKGDGIGVQILFRPTDGNWAKLARMKAQELREGKKPKKIGSGTLNNIVVGAGNLVGDLAEALWKPPEAHEKQKDEEEKKVSTLDSDRANRIDEKTKYPGFEVLIRIVASSSTKARADGLLGSVVSVFSQFDSPQFNGFKYDFLNNTQDLVRNYILRWFPQEQSSMILSSAELASILHLPHQNAIPTSQVERQSTKQVDGPTKVPDEGVILGVNEFRGEQKTIRLQTNDRRRHTYAIGATGSGKSVLLENIAYQDMCDGRGFCFIDPHGDAVEWLLSRVPQERLDDVILFEPGSMDNPVGMNMFEFDREDQKDFIVQEGINMLVSLYDPGQQGMFGARAQHMFRNAALLLMSDPAGGTFVDIPRCFIDPEFVKNKLQYVRDRNVYDYWTKEFPASQKSNDAGEVTTWFVSKWGPFLSNKMMCNILGQVKSGFNLRDIMDNKKILLVNLSKGTTGELNARLLGMIFVMKFQAAAMSRADTPEDQRQDFCLFVDEFQNFATESFESILSEARKYRLNLVLANQFMTQLTDKIREAIIGNVGTIMSGRIGVTDAELMQKAFSPVFTAEDLHKLPNYNWVATVMMFNTPTAPFTMRSLPPMGEGSDELMHKIHDYVLTKYGRPRAEVEAEIEARLAASTTKKEEEEEKKEVGAVPAPKKNFLDSWLEKKAALEKQEKANMGADPTPITIPKASVAPAAKMVEESSREEATGLVDKTSVPETKMVNEEELMINELLTESATEPESAPEPEPTPNPQADKQDDDNGKVRTEKNDADEVVLRWR